MEQLIADLSHAEANCLAEYERRRANFVWASSAHEYKHKAEGIRYAIDAAKRLHAEAS